jgi:hypothetical protein
MPPKKSIVGDLARRGGSAFIKSRPGSEGDGAQLAPQDDAADLIDALLSKKAKSPLTKGVVRPDDTDSDETTIEKSPATARRSLKPSAGRGAPKSTPSKRKLASDVHVKSSPGIDAAAKK